MTQPVDFFNGLLIPDTHSTALNQQQFSDFRNSPVNENAPHFTTIAQSVGLGLARV